MITARIFIIVITDSDSNMQSKSEELFSRGQCRNFLGKVLDIGILSILFWTAAIVPWAVASAGAD